MIVDSFDYIACYKGLHPNLDKAIDWLNSHTLDALENGKTIIDGENVFVNVMDADLRDADGAAFEYHRRYADLQIDLTGSEHLGWASEGTEQGEFDEAADCGFKSGAEHVGGVLGGGRFAIFCPRSLRHDAGRWPFRHLLPRRAAQAQLQKRRLQPRKKSRGQDFDEIIKVMHCSSVRSGLDRSAGPCTGHCAPGWHVCHPYK